MTCLILKHALVNTGHIGLEELTSASINHLQSLGYYGGGESYIVIPYLLQTPIWVVTSHSDSTAYVFYLDGQENVPLATITHANNHFQWVKTGNHDNTT